MKTGKLDEYAIEARVFPAFLALLPAPMQGLGLCVLRTALPSERSATLLRGSKMPDRKVQVMCERR